MPDDIQGGRPPQTMSMASRPEFKVEHMTAVMGRMNNEFFRRIYQHGMGCLVSNAEIRGVVDEEVEEMHEAGRTDNYQHFDDELFDVAIAAIVGCVSLRAMGYVK